MQQLQHPALQRAAWQRNTAPHTKQVLGSQLARARQEWSIAAAHSRFLHSRGFNGLQLVSSSISTSSSSNSSNSGFRQLVCSCAAGDASSGNGDVMRPSAHASAPSVPAVDLNTGTANGSGNSSSKNGISAGSSPGASSSSSSSTPSNSGARSYSELYKTLYTSGYSPTANSNSSKSSSTNSVSSNTGSATAPQHQAGMTSSTDGNGSSSSSSSNARSPEAAAATSAEQAPPAAGVEDAIRKAQEALAAAESSLSSIHKLRSAQPANTWHGLLQVLKSVATILAAGALLVASHAFGLGWQWAGATLGALGLAARAYQRNMVTPAGAAAAAAACLATLGCSMRFGLVMLVYAYTSFKLRNFKEAQLPVDYESLKRQEQPIARNWPEVFCTAAVPTIVAIVYGAMAGCLDLPLGALPAVEPWRADLLTLLQGAVLGWYACCCGDAWSSELGGLSKDQPRLLTTLKPVRKGTHGAVTLLGLSGAAAGGLLVGLVFYCAAVLSPTLWVFETQRHAAMAQWRLIPLGLIAGLAGSLLDSLLGATLQFTGYDSSTESLSSSPGPGVKRISGLQQTWLGDNLVNLLSAGVTAALTAVAALRMFG